jgi:hypothetical protein
MSDWRTITDDRERYKAYLCSREWALLRNEVRKRCGGKCERCKQNEMECVHHLTYARKYQERIEDLAGWCNACHDFTHGKADFDPVFEYSEEGQFWQWVAALRKHYTWGEMTSGLILGCRGRDVMGWEWMMRAAEGEFAGRNVEEEDLLRLVQERRKAQGINT